MFLDYGVDNNGELVYVGQVGRGVSALHCPYCGGLLTAKKGSLIAHHFAHSGETCRQTERDQEAIALPAYDNFNLHLAPKVLAELRKFDTGNYDGDVLSQHGLAMYNEFARNGRGDYVLTHKGKLVLGQLSLKLFNDFQGPLIAERHAELLTQATTAYDNGIRRPEVQLRLDQAQAEMNDFDAAGGNLTFGERGRAYTDVRMKRNQAARELEGIDGAIDLPTALSDLRLFRAQWRRVLACTLYFLEISGGKLYKIGITTRDIDERIAEIKEDMALHFGEVTIKVLGVWPSRANVELYFKYRYAAQNRQIGALTEYFEFSEIKPVLSDLRRMGADRPLSDLEAQVLAGRPSDIESRIKRDAIEKKRRVAIRAGMGRATNRGVNIGRPVGIETIADFLAKPSSQAIIAALADGASIRKAAEMTGTSAATVQKVKQIVNSKDGLTK